ncbi:hypothetical protein HanHA300_Chr13g0485701 [Helianthus annuus]|nr:hypothetical protein HanHA300_Chr13g0485701 [Helianthus annuus]KAJ0481596.1 hypothetical protein HanIR_Chr13g0644321 [Helianthus annuus]KAJ0498035.1 hypothetical protein HanHA89_Chr13g0517841 [Helianthus annuus]KAJ0664034.1 hypothetical protein HanLR1_Chr13g0487671 [Helianthus annuus]
MQPLHFLNPNSSSPETIPPQSQLSPRNPPTSSHQVSFVPHVYSFHQHHDQYHYHPSSLAYLATTHQSFSYSNPPPTMTQTQAASPD